MGSHESTNNHCEDIVPEHSNTTTTTKQSSGHHIGAPAGVFSDLGPYLTSIGVENTVSRQLKEKGIFTVAQLDANFHRQGLDLEQRKRNFEGWLIQKVGIGTWDNSRITQNLAERHPDSVAARKQAEYEAELALLKSKHERELEEAKHQREQEAEQHQREL